ncbi:MAG: Hsp20/alpha crystallin family protein [Pseudomonadota bacterium]
MWTRVRDFDRMFQAMDLLQSRLSGIYQNSDRSRWPAAGWGITESGPRTNMYDKGEALEIRVEVPGIQREDLNIKLQGNYLEISGTRKTENPEGYSTHRVERGASSFTRSFTLPSEVDATKVEATLKDGILTLVLDKAEPAKPKQIVIS